MSTRGWSVGVVIPARDEQATIEGCVRAARTALSRVSQIDRSWIVVVCDSCVDETQDRATRALEDTGQVISCGAMSVGAARRLGVAAVLAKFADVSSQRIWLANTDADTYVGPDWLEQQLSHADRGAAAVAGIVSVDNLSACEPDQVRALLHDYAVFEDGTHPHVHGANLGVRCDAYLGVGGWSNKSLAEDHCLWNRLKQNQWPVIASTASVVVTSGRLVGRAAGGFADLLRSRMTAQYG
jgi:cellulose synthase/poly-beta-1,6-N-acetylglucosamine synthase-like glycosyltransferase